MLLGYEMKQLLRTPLRTLTLCLALSLITGMMSVAYGLQAAADRMSEQVESEYVTIGYIPSTPEQYLDMNARFQKSFVSSKHPLYVAFHNGSFSPETVISIDDHSRTMAYDDSMLGAVSDIAKLNTPNSLAVFAVRCDEILPSSKYRDKQSYYYNFTVVQTLALHEDLPRPTRIVVDTTHYNLDVASAALHVGSTYLIWGYYEDLGENVAQLTMPLHFLDYDRVIKSEWETGGYCFFYFPNTEYPTHKLPLCAAYDGSPEAYVAQDTTGMWDTLMNTVRISHSSVQILSADHPTVLRPFIDGHAVLKEGDFFTEEMLAVDCHVALISDILAEKNGLSVGDTMDLHFYQSEYSDDDSGYFNGTEMMVPKQLFGENKAEDPAYRSRNGVTRTPISEQNDVYTIVGIYETDGWINRPEYLHPNTVIIPQSSLTELYAWDLPQFDLTFILPNGGVDAFEAELSEAGFGGIVHYYDQGYASIITGVEAICHSAEFVYTTVRLLWLLSAVMVLFLFTWMQLPTGKVKYRLGTGKRRIFIQMSASALGVLILSCLCGFAGSVLLYDGAVEWMMQADFTSFNATFSTMSANAGVLNDLLDMLGQPVEVFARICGMQLVILATLAVIFAAAAALRRKSFQR